MRNENNENIISEILEKLFNPSNNLENIKIKSKKFHITVRNNETDEVLCDEDTDCICGAFSRNETDMVRISFYNCKAIELLGALYATKKQAERLLPDDPLMRLLFAVGSSKD